MDLHKARHMHRSEIKRESQGRERPKEWQCLRRKALQRPHSAIFRNIELYVTRACKNTNNQQKYVNIDYTPPSLVLCLHVGSCICQNPTAQRSLPERTRTTIGGMIIGRTIDLTCARRHYTVGRWSSISFAQRSMLHTVLRGQG